MSLLGSTPGSRLGRIGARLGPRAGGFLAWWGHSLAAWVPRRWRRVLGFDRGRVLIQAEGEDLRLHLQQFDESRELGRLPVPGRFEDDLSASDPLAASLGVRLVDLPRWLVLPAASSLRRRLVLPAAAAQRLRDVVAFEIDRQTPFTADAVAFDARVLGHRENDDQIDAELVVVPRQVLDPQLTRLGPLAAGLAGIDIAATDGTTYGVNLLPPAQRRRNRDPWALWNWALTLLAVAALAALLAQLLHNRRAAAAVVEQRIAAQAPAGREAAAQRQRLTGLLEGQAFLGRVRAERPGTVEIIDELTRRLPDGTYLEKLSIDDRQLLLIGLSNEAAALVGRLQGADVWRSPALAGALQPDPESGRDRFTLTANLVPETASAPPPRAASPNPSEAGNGPDE